jgi:hypothetical protein
MGWGKIILMVQAIAVLIIGGTFILQLVNLDNADINEMRIELNHGNNPFDKDAPKIFVDFKQRYTIAAFILPIIALMELLIISRLAN